MLQTLFFIIFLFFSTSVNAIAKFNTTYQTYYKVEESGNTHVTFVINQTNNLSVVFATEYGISINSTKIKNVKISDEGVLVIPEVNQNENQTVISFPFAKKIVGKDKIHRFSIEYDTEDIALKQGNTWQINIPRFESDENVTDQTTILIVPASFTQPAYIDPKPDLVNGNNYYFSSKVLANRPISAIFGKNQYYKSTLDYFIQNNQTFKIETFVALPPDTSYQSVYYEKIEPEPIKVERDLDGNVLAYYQLNPNQSLKVTATVFFKTDFLPRLNKQNKLLSYTEKNNIWNWGNNIFTIPEVKDLSSPKAIYDYVVSKLTYDYQKINRDGTVRVPASDSLKNYQSAICTDFTDLFIAMARKAGIPARELQGLGISDNPNLKPISSTKDVLHAWPEFFDQNSGKWIQVDPTWGNTTRGVDYFNKLDFNHLVFAIHGQEFDKPRPAGGYKEPGKKTKDIQIEPIPEIQLPKAQAKIIGITKNGHWYELEIKNDSGVFLYGQADIMPTKYTEGIQVDLILAPLEKIKIKLKSKTLIFDSPGTQEVIIKINEQELSYPISNQIIFSKGTIFTIVITILGFLTLFTRSLLLRKRK